jgi:uncharacterized membrane protein
MEQAEKIINNVKSLKSNSQSMSMKKKKGTVTGSLIGAGVGMLYGLTKNYNIISSAIVGAVIGGLATHLILPSLDEE